MQKLCSAILALLALLCGCAKESDADTRVLNPGSAAPRNDGATRRTTPTRDAGSFDGAAGKPDEAGAALDVAQPSTCTQTLELDAGSGNTHDASIETNCSLDEVGDRFVCTCGNSRRGYRTYYVYDSGIDESCQIVQSLCALEDPPAFDGARTCRPQREIGEVGLCDTFLDCEQASDAIENVTMWGYEALHCADSGDGTASCNCETDQHRFRFELTAPIAAGSQCAEAMNVCSTCQGVDEECSPTGP